MSNLEVVRKQIDQRIRDSKKLSERLNKISGPLSKKCEAPSRETGKFFQILGEYKQLQKEIEFLKSIRDLLKETIQSSTGEVQSTGKPKTIGEVFQSNLDKILMEKLMASEQGDEIAKEQLKKFAALDT